MKKFLWLMLLIIVAGGVALIIYANRHKSTVATGTQDLGQVLGQNTETNNGYTIYTPPTEPTNQTPAATTPAPASTENTKPVTTPANTSTPANSATPVVSAAPTTKTYLIPTIGLEVTVPVSWYELSGASDASQILFYDKNSRILYGSIEVFLGANESYDQLQNDLLYDPTASDVRPTTYAGMQAFSFIKNGVSGRVTAFIHNGDVYYLKGQTLTQAKLKFVQ